MVKIAIVFYVFYSNIYYSLRTFNDHNMENINKLKVNLKLTSLNTTYIFINQLLIFTN